MKDVKKLLWIAAGIILAIALACGINLWQNAQVIRWQTDHMPELQHILTFAENKGADWATEELMISGVDGFRKKSLYKKWGNPTIIVSDSSVEEKKGLYKKWGNPTESEDIWVLSDQFQLVVDYDKHERIESVKVVPSTQTTYSLQESKYSMGKYLIQPQSGIRIDVNK